MQKKDVLAAMTGRYVDFYSSYTTLHQVAGAWRGPCPLHNGDGPNFVVNSETGCWYCHSRCQSGGDVFAFVQRREGIEFPAALQQVAEWAGTGWVPSSTAQAKASGERNEPNDSRPEPFSSRLIDPAIAQRAHAALMADPSFLDWLIQRRGFTPDTLVKYQIGLLPPNADGVRRVSFPVYDKRGNLTNIRQHLFEYKAGLDRTHKTLPWAKGLQADLFPLSALDNQEEILLVEGEADALLANQIGFKSVTGTLGAGNWKQHWTETLRGRRIIILYDSDEAGHEGALKAAASLAGGDCEVRVASVPKGKDLTEWIVGHGGTAEGVRAAIDLAPAFFPTPSADAPPDAGGKSFHSATSDSEEAGEDVGPTGPPATGDAPAKPVTLPSDTWPEADPEMFHGLAGEIVRTIDPHTEADAVAILVQLLVAFGSAIGRSAYFGVEADKHYTNLFVVIVGASSKGRKGTALGHVRRLFNVADPEWEKTCVQSGLSSGEGVIWHVRDATEKTTKDKETGDVEVVTVDPGIEEKRLLATETEYGAVLRLAGRDGNNLSAVLRDAWDRGQLQTMTKTNPVKATGAHISIIGHVTADELRRELSSTEAGNGFANRFLWVCAKRSKELPEGGNLTSSDLDPFTKRLARAIEAGRKTEKMVRNEAARQIWLAVYHDLSAGGVGLSGAVTSRGEAQVMRLALLYALLDGAEAIGREHMTAALAVWEYVEASARYVFGDSMGDPIADDILRALRNAPDGLSRNEIRELFQRHQSSGRIAQALALLLQHGRVRTVQKNTAGRPAEWWHIAKPYATPENAVAGGK